VAEGVIAEAWGHRAEEVAEAWPDTEANEEVTLIRGIAVTRARVSAKEEAIEDSDEAKGLIRCLSYCSLNILVSANRGA